MTVTWDDVSEYQGDIDWAAYPNPVACARAHNGYRPDFKWAQNRDGMRAHVKHPGFYHYLVKGGDPVGQAWEFIKAVGDLRPGEWTMLDAEAGDLRFDGSDVARATAFLNVVRGHWPHNPHTIYSEGSSFTGPLASIDPRWPKVVASIVSAESPDAPEWLRPSLGEVGWQFSWAHAFPGVAAPCDADRFEGTLAQWEAAIGFKGVPKPHVVRPSHAFLPKGVAALKRGDGGNGINGWAVAALQNGLRFATGAQLFPSSPPWLGPLTERAVHDLQVFLGLVPRDSSPKGAAAGAKTIAALNHLIDTKPV